MLTTRFEFQIACIPEKGFFSEFEMMFSRKKKGFRVVICSTNGLGILPAHDLI